MTAETTEKQSKKTRKMNLEEIKHAINITPFYEEKGGVLYNCDCMDILKKMPNNSVDLVLTDPPYGVTQNEEDKTVELSELFRVSKGIILTTQQPYTTDIISQFRKFFRYDLIWDKILSSGFLNANRMPLRIHEIILVFGDVIYNPQKSKGAASHNKGKKKECKNENYGKYSFVDNVKLHKEMKYPKSILHFPKPHPSIAIHRTEKPIALFEYLIKTYSNNEDLILDPFLGSGTTTVACKQLGRKWIGIEISKDYCEIAKHRLFQQTLY